MTNDTLITVFLRGGADGLALAPPVGDPQYPRVRPASFVRAADALRLDGFFALAPELAALAPLWSEGQLALVHDVGTSDTTRSHFYAQPLLERGAPDAAGGWLARFAKARSSALPALAFGDTLPESLRGGAAATALRALSDLDPGARVERLAAELSALYDRDALLAESAANTRTALAQLRALDGAPYRPAAGVEWGSDAFSQQLAQTARLLKHGARPPVVCLDLHGWDSHVAQAQLLAPLLRQLGAGLANFAADLGALFERTSVVVYTEFGRRVAENSGLGTDHGHGFALLVLGGGVRGGVHARWSGLEPDALVGPGDLPGSIDYRAALAPVVERHGVDARAVFGELAQPALPL
jgi:uncharacterized protein (DUF1501 family)